LGFPAGRRRIGLVKGVVPMPKLPESGHRDKSGHCCIAQLFGVGLPAALAARELGRCPRQQQHFGTAAEYRPAQLFGFTPQAAGCYLELLPPGIYLHNCAVLYPRQPAPGPFAQLCGFFFPDASMQLLPFSTRHILKKKLLTLYIIYGNLWY